MVWLPPSGRWVSYGLPFVPVMALVIAAYFYFMVHQKLTIKSVNVASIVRREAKRQGPMTRDEYITAATLVLVIVLWIAGGEAGGLGMGGPVLLGIVILARRAYHHLAGHQQDLLGRRGAVRKRFGYGRRACRHRSRYVDRQRLRRSLAVVPVPRWKVSPSPRALFTGIATNFMSDGATVSALGPVAIPMAQLSGTPPWMVGFATAFASSFANVFIIGTPNNAIALFPRQGRGHGRATRDFAGLREAWGGSYGPGPSSCSGYGPSSGTGVGLASDREPMNGRWAHQERAMADNIKLLIVDDEVRFLQTLSKRLSMRDFDVTSGERRGRGDRASAIAQLRSGSVGFEDAWHDW